MPVINDRDYKTVMASPYRQLSVNSDEEARAARGTSTYVGYIKKAIEIADILGMHLGIVSDNRGGYKLEGGGNIVEISETFGFKDATDEQLEMFSCLLGALAPECQEGVSHFKYVDARSNEANGFEVALQVKDINKAIETLQANGIKRFTINEGRNLVKLLAFFDGKEDKKEQRAKLRETYKILQKILKEDGNYDRITEGEYRGGRVGAISYGRVDRRLSADKLRTWIAAIESGESRGGSDFGAGKWNEPNRLLELFDQALGNIERELVGRGMDTSGNERLTEGQRRTFTA